MVQSRKLLKNEEKELEEQKVGIAEGVVSLHNLIVIPRFHLAVPFFLKKSLLGSHEIATYCNYIALNDSLAKQLQVFFICLEIPL